MRHPFTRDWFTAQEFFALGIGGAGRQRKLHGLSFVCISAILFGAFPFP